ncbi:MAG: FGGY-family carbohydrate kinase [Rhizobiaceae bacterium]
MGKVRHVAVIDIGKTNAKVLLIDLQSASEVIIAKASNSVRPAPPYPHFDEAALWNFILSGLSDIAASHPLDAISITTHGACAALVDGNGTLVLPVLDYEFDGPDEMSAQYDAQRPPFAETGSPRLPAGLNLGAQLFWLANGFPPEFAKAKHVLTWPQYWAMKLTGIAASELTSLGCHTDLWDPWNARFSSMVKSHGWRHLFPSVRSANAVLGTLKAEVAARTQLDAATPVHCGIHDSNASLLPYLGGAEEKFAVMSTGTWMITLAVGGRPVALDVRRDTLVNVNANGGPTPTSRYMAGREFDDITQGKIVTPADGDQIAVLSGNIMATPSLHPDTGPFPGLGFTWLNGGPASDGERTCAASYYCALMGAVCLELIGAEGPVYVEGPFAGNQEFKAMLATACGRPVIASGQSAGTGLGAAMLAGPLGIKPLPSPPVLPSPDPAMRAYAEKWLTTVNANWAEMS